MIVSLPSLAAQHCHCRSSCSSVGAVRTSVTRHSVVGCIACLVAVADSLVAVVDSHIAAVVADPACNNPVLPLCSPSRRWG